MKIEFPVGCSEFKKAIILLDKAISYLVVADEQESILLITILEAIVNAYDGCQDE